MSKIYQRRIRRPVQRKGLDMENERKQPKGNAYRVSKGAMTPQQIFRGFGSAAKNRGVSQKKEDNSASFNSKIFNNIQRKKQSLPIQCVLIDPTKAALEANLINQYHTAETNGDNTSRNTVNNINIAINHYKRARTLRRRVGRMHVGGINGPHQTAINTLTMKINGLVNRRTQLQQPSGGGRRSGKRPVLAGYRGGG